jgi:hypothetical protein
VLNSEEKVEETTEPSAKEEDQNEQDGEIVKESEESENEQV